MEDAEGLSEPPSPIIPDSPSVTLPRAEIVLVCDASVRAGGPSGNGLSEADLAWLADRAERACGVLGAGGECRVRIVDDREMSALHERWLGDPTTTDVMTFDLSEGASAESRELDCDLIVCRDEASRRAAELGHEPRRELLLYILHGVLHCLGFDDTDDAGWSRMHAEEDRVLDAIGVGATFGDGGAS